MEDWLPMPDYEGFYEVSNLGRVRSLYFSPPRPVKLIADSNGYLVAMLTKNRRRTPKTVHRLVCRAFHGEQPNPLHKEVCHLDGDRTNARAENLRWVGRIQNLSHRRAHGTLLVGERHPRAKLTDEAVREIRARPGTRAKLAKKFGVSGAVIDDVRAGKTWRHVT